jgi:hypothetical protein
VYNTHHPELLAPFPKWKNKFTWGKTRGVPMYCISSASERKHEIWMHLLVILSLKTLWAGVKRWRTALHRFYVYRNTYFISRDSTMCTFEVLLLCVWCLDNWSRILSGKPFNTFSMARLKTLQFFFSGSVIVVFGLFSCDPRFMAHNHIDSPWFVKFSKMTNINSRESWFGFFFY